MLDQTDDRTVLRTAGLRVTAPRLAVLEAVRNQPHVDADSVQQSVRTQLGKVSVQAVYDVLHALTGAGLLRRIQPAGSVARYEVRVGDNHHHMICRQCRTITDIDCAVGARPCLDPDDHHGYLLDEAEVTYWGICPECRAKVSSEPK